MTMLNIWDRNRSPQIRRGGINQFKPLVDLDPNILRLLFTNEINGIKNRCPK